MLGRKSGANALKPEWRVASSTRLQTVALDHTRLDHAGVQGQEHDAGVQVVAGLEGGCQAHFHRFRQAWVVALREALRAQHAVAEKLRRRGARGRVGAGTGLSRWWMGPAESPDIVRFFGGADLDFGVAAA